MTAPATLAHAQTDQALQAARWRADPLADQTVAAILGPWPEGDAALDAQQWARLQTVNRLFDEWDSNGALSQWAAQGDGVDPALAQALNHYVHTAQQLPEWADARKIERAESLFMEHGALSCILLFCASLPECYVLPDLATVLHTTGQLEQHTQYRVRATAAMIFPVMMVGGMTQVQGGGLAQVLKVRLIHATVRNLILRGSPDSLHARFAAPHEAVLSALQLPSGTRDMHRTLFARGWDVGAKGLPCNQQELAYTLLTFGYVFLRGQRQLGLQWPTADEEAFLHAWNVVGHVLGIHSDLLVHTMQEGEALMARMQAQGRQQPSLPDARPALGQALMQAMSDALPWQIAKPFPALMTRWLCGPMTAKDLGLSPSTPWLSRLLFWCTLWAARAIDAVVGAFFSRFSLLRMLARALGYHLMSQVLMSQTRPLKLPHNLLQQVDGTVHGWSHDTDAPAWLNWLEDRLTTHGSWSAGLANAKKG